jgi:hypothetical protein
MSVICRRSRRMPFQTYALNEPQREKDYRILASPISMGDAAL